MSTHSESYVDMLSLVPDGSERAVVSSWLRGVKPPLAMRRPACLDEVLKYSNDQVVARFLTLYRVSDDESHELFAETKKFLWACSRAPCSLAPTTIIDKMWHNFVLFTSDYPVFCLRYFGYFIHHHPADKHARELTKRENTTEFRTNALQELQSQLEFLYDTLGENTVAKWYIEYPNRYDERFFESRSVIPTVRKPILSNSLQDHLDYYTDRADE